MPRPARSSPNFPGYHRRDCPYTTGTLDAIKLAPIVPLYSSRQVDLVSKRLGNYQYNPQFFFLVDQAWVKQTDGRSMRP